MINIVKDESNFKEFKELELDEKLDLLETYCSEKELSKDIVDILEKMVTECELKNKCDINYDKINKKICNINILKFDKEKDCYYFNKKK